MILIQPGEYSEDDFRAYLSLYKNEEEEDLSDYGIGLEAEDWHAFKDLVDEIFRHMQPNRDRIAKEA